MGLERPSSFKLFASLPSPVKFLVLGTAINFSGAMVGPLLSIVLVRIFALTPTDASWIAASYASGSFVSVFCGGILTDKVGRRRTLLLSMFGAGLVGIGLAVSSSLTAFHFFIILFAFFSELYRPASSSLTADLLDSHRRVFGYAAVRVAINVGGFVAMFLGGYFLDHNWRWMLWFDALTCLSFGCIVFFKIQEPAKPVTHNIPPLSEGVAVDVEPATEPHRPPRSKPPWQEPAFRKYFLMSSMLCLVYASHFSVLPLTMAREGHLTNQTIGTIMGLNGLMVVVFELSTIARLSRFRRLRVAAGGCLLIGLGLGVTALHTSWIWYVFTLLVWTVGEITCFSFLTAFVSDLAPADRRGQYLSYSALTWRGALAINPLISMPLYERMPIVPFWLLHFALVLPAAALLLHLDRRHDRRN